MDTKLDSVITYDMKPPPTKSTFDQVVMWGHVTRLKPYFKRPMATKPDMLLAFDNFDKGQSTTKSNDSLVKWSLVTSSRDKKRYSSTSTR